MLTHVGLMLVVAAAVPAASWAQFVEKGKYVEVAKGTMLCLNKTREQSRGVLDPGRGFWRVTSKPRANGTQSVAAYTYETSYDRKSGDTTTMERRYDEDYAILFQKDPDHQGMLLMISPQDGRVQASVEICVKRPGLGAGFSGARK
jgi:hypothetical protein